MYSQHSRGFRKKYITVCPFEVNLAVAISCWAQPCAVSGGSAAQPCAVSRGSASKLFGHWCAENSEPNLQLFMQHDRQQTLLTFLHNKMLHLPTVIGRPFLYHSTFKFESVTGSNLHSKWACCPSLMLSKLFGLVRKRGLMFTTSSTYSDFLYREESSKYWIFSKPDGCWESRIRSFLAET